MNKKIFFIFFLVLFLPGCSSIGKTLKTYNWTDTDTKALVEEIKNKNESYCEKIPEKVYISTTKNFYPKAACYFLIAQLKEDSNLCNKVPNGPVGEFGYTKKEECILKFAKGEKDIKLCEIITEQSARDNCFYQYIINLEKDSSNLCEYIKTDYLLSDCIARTSKGQLCKDLKSEGKDMESNCLKSLFRHFEYNFKNIKVDSSVCEKIGPRDDPNECFIYFASASKDPDDCLNLPKSYFASRNEPNNCYLMKAKINKDKSFCNYIKDYEALKKECFENYLLDQPEPGIEKFKMLTGPEKNSNNISVDPFYAFSDM